MESQMKVEVWFSHGLGSFSFDLKEKFEMIKAKKREYGVIGLIGPK